MGGKTPKLSAQDLTCGIGKKELLPGDGKSN